MALKIRDLSVIGYANGFTLHHYRTSDAAATVAAANYFDSATGQVRVGDRIMLETDIDGTPAYSDVVVTAITDGAVTIATV